MKLDLTKGSRERFLAIAILVVIAVFIGRLFYLQVIQHQYYVDLAQREQQRQLDIPAERGKIYALDGEAPVPLVLNRAVYTVFADPSIIKNDQAVISLIERFAKDKARPNLDTLLANKKSRYAVLATNVSRERAEQMKQQNLLGVGFTKESERVYPEGRLAAQVLGFVNAENKGQYGIEGALNQRLVGRDGSLKTVADVRDVPLTIGNKNISRPAKDGDNLVLTVDRNVQAYAEQALARQVQKNGAKQASVLVMDPRNSKVLAMANLPTFDPNKYQNVQDAAQFQNDTISLPYEPGSDIKTLTAAIGIDQGVIRPDSTYNNTDYIKVDDITVTNATKGQTGTITMQHAMNYSLNTGFVTIAQRLGNGSYITTEARTTMYDYFHNKFRLGSLTGIALQGEASGIVVSPKEVQGNAVRYSNMSFGQGFDATMLQVATAFCSLVNGGTYRSPTIVGGVIDGDGQYRADSLPPATRVLKQSTADTVRDMVQKARGAFYATTDKTGYRIGGKTGTSQAIVDGKYSDTETIATYLGFGGPADGPPRYVIMVRMSGSGQNLQGNADAMPVFNDLSNWMIDYLKLQPKG